MDNQRMAGKIGAWTVRSQVDVRLHKRLKSRQIMIMIIIFVCIMLGTVITSMYTEACSAFKHGYYDFQTHDFVYYQDFVTAHFEFFGNDFIFTKEELTTWYVILMLPTVIGVIWGSILSMITERKIIKPCKTVFENSYLNLENGADGSVLRGCGSSAENIDRMESFSLRSCDIVDIYSSKATLTFYSRYLPKNVDEITIVTRTREYKIWGLLDSGNLVMNIKNNMRQSV